MKPHVRHGVGGHPESMQPGRRDARSEAPDPERRDGVRIGARERIVSDAHALELASMDRGCECSRLNPELSKLTGAGAELPESAEGVDGVHARQDGRASSSLRAPSPPRGKSWPDGCVMTSILLPVQEARVLSAAIGPDTPLSGGSSASFLNCEHRGARRGA